jgi:hypothetical protein
MAEEYGTTRVFNAVWIWPSMGFPYSPDYNHQCKVDNSLLRRKAWEIKNGNIGYKTEL